MSVFILMSVDTLPYLNYNYKVYIYMNIIL